MTNWVKVECPLCGEMAVAETHPNLKRTWVGLTDEQFLKACQLAEAGNYLVAFQRIQEWLKEKNT